MQQHVLQETNGELKQRCLQVRGFNLKLNVNFCCTLLLHSTERKVLVLVYKYIAYHYTCTHDIASVSLIFLCKLESMSQALLVITAVFPLFLSPICQITYLYVDHSLAHTCTCSIKYLANHTLKFTVHVQQVDVTGNYKDMVQLKSNEEQTKS